MTDFVRIKFSPVFDKQFVECSLARLRLKIDAARFEIRDGFSIVLKVRQIPCHRIGDHIERDRIAVATAKGGAYRKPSLDLLHGNLVTESLANFLLHISGPSAKML